MNKVFIVKAKKIVKPTNKQPPYHKFLNAPYGEDGPTLKEMKLRNELVRAAREVEFAILEKLEAGELPELEARITERVLSEIVGKLSR